ncbi:hypothetical protein [Nocardioides aurantiacus]|uniref:hypothetical protein n=1 Tax=Nocardioides aurantiacus TaxID=86796 RepID=UPI001B885825|nr:hypothetical protein [Nocardioides aurantiacus]
MTTTAPAPTSAGDPVTTLFASRSVTEHVLRGLLGLALVVAALWQASAHPAALLLLVPAVVAWRGCPTCWALGLAATVSRGRTPACTDGSCRS